jgi:hypothetical protein
MQSENTSKRQWLTEIVAGLGPEATPPQIREEAYRVGFGAINSQMLIAVRNKLWPDRPRRTSGYSRDQRERAEQVAGRAIPCPQCSSIEVLMGTRTSLKTNPGFCTRRRTCRDCGHSWKSLEPDEPLRAREGARIRWATMTEKPCTYCKRILPIEAFSLVSGSDVIRRPGCKECAADYRATFGERDLLKRYGITLDDYQAMLERQGGRCAICGTDDPFGKVDNNMRRRKRRVFSVDHCHATGKVRGLLCCRCNLAIGNFGDDTTVMRAAIDYIDRHRNEGESDA